MTKMLASVNCLEEALIVLNQKVDIIDLKQPNQGALGALDINTVNEIVIAIAGQCPISATVGDLPTQPDLVFNAVQAMAKTGVDYIKIGFFQGGDAIATINKLAQLTTEFKLIAVLFADIPLDLSLLAKLTHAGFAGVMLDTMNKSSGSLLQLRTNTELQGFVRLAKTHGLLCGLAGSLRLQDITHLLNHQADYLGFRGALCAAHQRTGLLDSEAIAKIRRSVI
jgi:dihydroneopterin aldolase